VPGLAVPAWCVVRQLARGGLVWVWGGPLGLGPCI